MRFMTTIPIQAPAEVVWRTMSQIERWPEWTPTVTSVDPSNTNGIRIGDTAQLVQPGQRNRTWKVTEVLDGEYFTWEATDPGRLKLSAVHRAITDDTGTTVELGFTVSGPTAWLAGLLAARTISRSIKTEAQSLKDWCEKHS